MGHVLHDSAVVCLWIGPSKISTYEIIGLANDQLVTWDNLGVSESCTVGTYRTIDQWTPLATEFWGRVVYDYIWRISIRVRIAAYVLEPFYERLILPISFSFHGTLQSWLQMVNVENGSELETWSGVVGGL